MQFLRYQPERDRQWRGWLVRTAQCEAWRLTAPRPEVPFVGYDDLTPGAESEPADPRDRLEERLEFHAALQGSGSCRSASRQWF